MNMKHPLIDRKNSSHYDAEEKTAIEVLEDEMTICEMRGFCHGNISKYRYRLYHKGQSATDLEKIVHYDNYLKELTHLKFIDGINEFMIVSRAWRLAKIKWDYR